MVERGGCDGYNTVRIQFIVDEPVTDQEEIGQYCHTYNTCPVENVCGIMPVTIYCVMVYLEYSEHV